MTPDGFNGTVPNARALLDPIRQGAAEFNPPYLALHGQTHGVQRCKASIVATEGRILEAPGYRRVEVHS